MKGMKSAYEIAMEKLEKSEGKHAPLSDEQKKRIAEVNDELEARLAEIKITGEARMQEARSAGDMAGLEELQQERLNDMQKAREEAEAKKKEIRGA